MKKKIIRAPWIVRIWSFVNYMKFRFGPKVKLEVIEDRFLRNVATADKENAIVILRFETWLRSNKMRPNGIDKTRMRQAFRAGWDAKDWGKK